MKPSTLQDGQSKYNIMILGDRMVGKTTLTLQFCFNYFTKTAGHGYVEDTYIKQLIVDGESCTVQLLDGPSCREHGGFDLIRQALEQALNSNPAEETGIRIVLLYSIMRKSSCAYVAEILRLLQMAQQSSRLCSAPERLQLRDDEHSRNRLSLSLAGNKLDLSRSGRPPSQRQVTTEEGRVLAEKTGNEFRSSKGCSFREISARDGRNEIDNIFINIVREMRLRQAQIDEDVRGCCCFF